MGNGHVMVVALLLVDKKKHVKLAKLKKDLMLSSK